LDNTKEIVLPSLDFEKEKSEFRVYYSTNKQLLEEAKNSFVSLISSLLAKSNVAEITSVEGRVKDLEECIKKFSRKYLSTLEAGNTEYTIKEYVSDLIGLRIICLYEDHVQSISNLLIKYFSVIKITDKISAVESTEDSFGYKGLHLDLQLNETGNVLPEHQLYVDLSFEVQIRTIIQDGWSVLDHKIKYKKSIPKKLKRRINILSALFELADREFKEIREATDLLVVEATEDPDQDPLENGDGSHAEDKHNASTKVINAFSFLRIAGHFFRDYEFVDYKVDGFVQDIIKLDPEYNKGDLHKCLTEKIKTVKQYKEFVESSGAKHKLNPYALIKHCLFLSNQEIFSSALKNTAKEKFLAWLQKRSNDA
jgi:putative GTP pyrophosphokinase